MLAAPEVVRSHMARRTRSFSSTSPPPGYEAPESVVKTERLIPVAVIGTGRTAREVFAPAILQNSGFHFRALWSRSEEAAQRFNLEVAGCSLEVFHGPEGFERLLARREIEAFAVALPAAVQPSYVSRILALGKHVISNRPDAINSDAEAEMERLHALAVGKAVWFISDPLRYEPVFQPSNLKLGDLGTILVAELHAVLVAPRLPQAAEEGAPKATASERALQAEVDGGALFVGGAAQHMALLQQLMGRAASVSFMRISDRVRQDLRSIRVGAMVVAAESFVCDSEDRAVLAPGVRGTVLRVDELGDALIDFEGFEAAHWVCKPQHMKLRILQPADAEPAPDFWGDALSGTVSFESGALCVVSWQTSASSRDERFRLMLQGVCGSATVELDMGTQSAAVGLRCYTLRRTLHEATRRHKYSFPSSGFERQLAAWGAAVRALQASVPWQPEDPAQKHDRSTLNSIVDIMVASGAVQSKGDIVQIKERSQRPLK